MIGTTFWPKNSPKTNPMAAGQRGGIKTYALIVAC